MTTRQLNRACHAAAQMAEIKKHVSLHTLRHSFATHLLEQSIDIRVIQVLLGHAKLDTTARYTRVATGMIAAIKSPLDRLSQPRKSPGRAGRPAAGVTAGRVSRPALEVADIFRDHGAAWRRANAGHVSLDQLKVMCAIERCRTAALGGHVARCERDLRPHRHRLQQLPQPALPQVPGRCGKRVARRARGRSAAGAVLSCGVHAAGGRSPTSPTRTRR